MTFRSGNSRQLSICRCPSTSPVAARGVCARGQQRRAPVFALASPFHHTPGDWLLILLKVADLAFSGRPMTETTPIWPNQKAGASKPARHLDPLAEKRSKADGHDACFERRRRL